MAEEEKKIANQQKKVEIPPDDDLFTTDISKILAGSKSTTANDSAPPSGSELFAAGDPDLSPGSGLFAADISEDPSEQDVFVGDEDFYKLLAKSKSKKTAGKTGIPIVDRILPVVDRIRHEGSGVRLRNFSKVEKILIASIIMITTIILYNLFKPPTSVQLEHPPAIAMTPAPSPELIALSTPSPESEIDITVPALEKSQALKTTPVFEPFESISLEIAENFYLTGNYTKAYAAYDQLRQTLPDTTEGNSTKDFLQFKMALCMKNTGDLDQANQLLRMIAESRSVVVRVAANYYMTIIETQRKQYLKARSRAYQTLALVGIADFDRNWAMAVERNCYILIAEMVTRKAFSLCDIDSDLPRDLWSSNMELDPFAGLDEIRLNSVLRHGSKHLLKGLLGPQIKKIHYKGTVPRWSVISQRAPVEELLARFATNTELNISWNFGPNLNLVRKRPVTLNMPAATVQQLINTAAGSTGLIAQWEDNSNLTIFNPDTYSSISKHTDLLTEKAVALWQNLLLTFQVGQKAANAHFALGLLRAQRGRTAEAISEYKFVANQFSQSSLAPFALLHSSRLKTNLRDYAGARNDLQQLVGQYPDSKLTTRAFLYLADATMKIQRYYEASQLYRKVYNLNISSQSRTKSAFGVARCYYEMKEHESAAKWLIQYLSISQDQTSDSLYLAYFLLGKSCIVLDKPKQACNAFQYALAGQLSKEQYVETILAMTEGQINQNQFIKALNTLENIQPWKFSQKESIEILLLKTRILRSMGLMDKAIAALADRTQYVADSQLKARMLFELTMCHLANHDFKSARKKLTQTLDFVESGVLAHEVISELAHVCLKLSQYPQAISVCLQLLELNPSQQIKRRTLNILASAYKQQKNYDKAAASIIGQVEPIKTSEEKLTLNIPDVTNSILTTAR